MEVNEQITRPFLNATQKPDVIVTEKGRNPVVIEVNENYRDHGRFSKKLYSVLYECMDLCEKEYIILEDAHALGLTDIIPRSSYSPPRIASPKAILEELS